MKVAVLLLLALTSALLLISSVRARHEDVQVVNVRREMGEVSDASAPDSGAAYPVRRASPIATEPGSGSGEGEEDTEGEYDLAPDPALVVVESIKYAGSGCGVGTSAGILAPDAKSISPFAEPAIPIVAKSGPGISIADHRQNCHYSVIMTHPVGWSYALVAADFGGSVSLDDAATASQDSYYYFQGVTRRCAILPVDIQGPRIGAFESGNLTYETPPCWSPCGNERYLQINVAARMKTRGATGTISIENQKFFLKWKKCGVKSS